jgi:hypothetical protein
MQFSTTLIINAYQIFYPVIRLVSPTQVLVLRTFKLVRTVAAPLSLSGKRRNASLFSGRLQTYSNEFLVKKRHKKRPALERAGRC